MHISHGGIDIAQFGTFRVTFGDCCLHHQFFCGPRGKSAERGRAVISYSIIISTNFDFNDLLELHYAINTATPSLRA